MSSARGSRPATKSEPATTCVACPAYGTDACEVLEELGSYCDVLLATSEWADRSRACRERRELGRPGSVKKGGADRIH